MKAKVTQATSRRLTRPAAIAARRTRAGLVYIETLAVCGVLAILLAGGAFTFSLYSAKLDTIYAARREAWQRAMPGCAWQSACERPSKSGAAKGSVQSSFELSWASRLETRTVVSCNEPSREDDSLKDVLRTFTTEVAKTGPRTVPAIALPSFLIAIVSAAQLSQEAVQCLWRSIAQSPQVEAVRPLVEAALQRALSLIL